ncbi:deoxyguanosinetriphosphate triphosphohydrolase [Nakamurella aerolata]|uniref:Deoxyguanosinetriphosphate triphosphohydrolase-like protein n=1 Tax=Nakamurella aerolata TaxID=1656892 RepID=A0A849ACP9_9ACTN|nr:deoxyguanosinetriphosphate triphosphohydrolase [Nakamurella aerolata]NNG37503.1 deoxyguanosinetriphosphate triphosphohydrolase [Nakamurella aerolata]
MTEPPDRDSRSSAPPGYSGDDVDRLVREPGKSAELAAGSAPTSGRSPFARDRARVLHSGALRRLAGKTQVVPPDEDDVPRTRLTHSLEVAQIARGIGSQLGTDPDLVDLAGLAHDIGHPPFGHNGEAVLNEIGAAAGGFEANAQNLRLLTELEPKVLAPDGSSVGLNLTRAALDAVIKYPWARAEAPGGTGKFGVYPEQQPVLEWIRPAGGSRLCLEAQIMDWADDVAYSVHDVEDGIVSGRIDLQSLRGPAAVDERLAVAEAAGRGLSTESAHDLAEVLGELLDRPEISAATHFRPGLAGQAELKRASSELTGRMINGAVTATRRQAGDGPLTRYQADLLVPRRLRAEVAMLKAVAVRYVMRTPARQATQEHQQQILTELVTALHDRGAEALDPLFAPRWIAAGDDAARLRVVLDQVALLTDAEATRWHRRLTG